MLKKSYAPGMRHSRVADTSSGRLICPFAKTQNSKYVDLMAVQRKHAILFAATLLSARKIIDALDSSKPNPGKDSFIEKTIKEAAAVLAKIDQRWPSGTVSDRQ